MSSTYTSLHYHFVFSTKRRMPSIDAAWRSRLFEYIGGTVRGLDGVPEIAGGVSDHVHILAGLKATHQVSHFMRDLKGQTSVWVHEEIGQRRFAWQDGYAAFTVSATSRKGVRSYIQNQEKHHEKKSLKEELIELLEKAGVEYDPKFLD